VHAVNRLCQCVRLSKAYLDISVGCGSNLSESRHFGTETKISLAVLQEINVLVKLCIGSCIHNFSLSVHVRLRAVDNHASEQISLQTYLLGPDLLTADGYWHYQPVQSINHRYDRKVSTLHIIIIYVINCCCWGMCEHYAQVADNVHMIVPARQVVSLSAGVGVQDRAGDGDGVGD